ncbi:MAG: cupin domain-containing protein [Bacteroidales bacterium]|nr:cupin domain-containing protein [Bacteroidales bacterium]MDD3891749.1 cupin domain-containing protein [Bacteroidales bacterium]
MANEFVKSKKFNFITEVEYSSGGIVSKNVLKRPTGNLSLFAFDKGESLSTHTAPFDAIIQVLEGNARITIGGEPNDLVGGETIIMPANIPHSVVATERFKMVLIMIKDQTKTEE